ncbi:MAG: N-acetylmuramidase family protein, partial [Terricaulis sp.]
RVLFEPHIFSRLTNHRFNDSHPAISYSLWDAGRYPRTQDGRWEQVTEAYALAPDEALSATSWGAFQIMGFQYRTAGYDTVQAFVIDVVRSPQHELAAWARWVQASGLVDEIQRKDWAGFARRYNGASYAERGYDRLMAEAYARLTTAAN